MKRILSFLMAFILVITLSFGMAVPTSADPSPLKITVSSQTATRGQTRDITIGFSNNDLGVCAVGIDVSFPSDLILEGVVFNEEFKAMDPDNKKAPAPLFDYPRGGDTSPVSFNWVNLSRNLTGDLVFATLTFKVADDATLGDKDISITYNDGDILYYSSGTFADKNLQETDITPDIVNGKITVFNCSHEHTISYPAVASTCTVAGHVAYTYCNDCQSIISGDDTPLALAAHTPGSATKENEVPATCTATGSYNEVVKCTVCGKLLSRTPKTTPALGHTAGTPVKENIVAADCTTGGTYDEVVYCTLCGVVMSWTPKTTDALGHKYDEVVTSPTCTERGYTTYTCSRCGDRYIDNYVNATGHAWGDWVTLAPATCTTKGAEMRICANDPSHVENRYIAELGHDYKAVVTPPTCTQGGYTTYTCSVCGDSCVDDYTDALGHTDTEIRNAKAVTCTADGYTGDTYCKVCGEKIETGSVIPATGHTAGEWIIDKKATLTETGLKHNECLVCGETVDTQVIPVIDPNAPRIEIESKKARTGKTVDVNISFINNPGITSAKLKIYFPAGLTLEDVNFGDIGGSTITSEEYDSPVILNWYIATKDLKTPNFVYATLTFSVAEDIEIGEKDIIIEFDPEDIIDITRTVIPFESIDGKLDVVKYMPGDINDDDKLNNQDLVLLFQYLSGWNVEVNKAAVDVTGDGKENNQDLVLLFQYLSGWEVEIF